MRQLNETEAGGLVMSHELKSGNKHLNPGVILLGEMAEEMAADLAEEVSDLGVPGTVVLSETGHGALWMMFDGDVRALDASTLLLYWAHTVLDLEPVSIYPDPTLEEVLYSVNWIESFGETPKDARMKYAFDIWGRRRHFDYFQGRIEGGAILRAEQVVAMADRVLVHSSGVSLVLSDTPAEA